ncbi:GerAB/ArcD/ProY family transporter [Pelosinus baikalensis]|uniref:Spore germination protein n=1 Tax=Pelosinus baikalensis TaxID=2892015 RepID=A0ABS8HUI7_9FIRM|nr:GerAB/ArcD/ProY family transporter [Pelosinus baikalensis]MCC5465782.1 spore germination protein [Pelosinus baikalensis]
MIRISNYQLFSLMVLFEIGSSILFVSGIDAKQDAWIVVLLSMFVGFALMWVYTELQKKFPQENLAAIIIKILGKYLGIPLVLLYALFFLYCSTRIFRDFGEVIVTTFLVKTPLLVVLIVFMLTALYVLFLGLEVLGRTSEILLPIVLFSIISVIIMVGISGRIQLEGLSPVLANGWQPVFKEVYPKFVNSPFGEAAVFMMYWCYLDTKQPVRKISFWAISTAGLIITIIDVISICVLGVTIAGATTIPFLGVIKLINIGDIITNLDAFGIVLMFIGGFYKMILFFYGGVQAFATVFKGVDSRWIMVLSAIFVLWLSIVFEPNYPYHIWLGHKVSLPYIHNVFQTIIPPFLLLIYWFKGKDSIC